VVFIGEMIVRIVALKPALYFRNGWFFLDFMNGLVGVVFIGLKITEAIYKGFKIGTIRPLSLKIWPGKNYY